MAGQSVVFNLLIRARDSASSVVKKFGGSITSLTAKVTALVGSLAGIIGIGSLASFFKSSITAASDLESRMNALRAVIESTGGAAGFTAEEIDAYARELDDASLGSAEGFRKAATVMATYKSVTGDTFKEAIRLSQDLTQVFGGDVVSATNRMGRALEDPIKGISALARNGVTFDKSQKELIKTLVETGNIAKAQGVILEALAGQVGGAGKGASQGLAGEIDGLSTRFTELKEQIGAAILPSAIEFFGFLAQQVSQLTEKAKELVAAGDLQRWAQDVFSIFKSGTQAVLEFIRGFDFGEAISKIKEFVEGVSVNMDTIRAGFDKATAASQILWNTFSAGVKTAGAVLAGFGAGALTLLDKLLIVPEAFRLIPRSMRESVGEAESYLEDLSKEYVAGAIQDTKDISNAWERLTGNIDKSAKVARQAAEDRKTAADVEAAAAQAAADAAQRAANDALILAANQKEAAYQAEQHQQKIADLRAEYQSLLEAGDTQGAAEALIELNAELSKTENQLKKTGDATDEMADDVTEVAIAFEKLNIQSQAELDEFAAAAVQSFERIRNSGTAAPEDVKRAFLAAAQAQINAAELSSEAERKALAIRLELQGATLGLTEEIKRLTGANEETSQSADKAAESQKKAANEAKEAAKESREAAEEAAESAEQAADNASNITIAVGSVAEGFRQLSDAGKQAFDDLAQGFQGLLTPDKARQLDAQRSILRSMVDAEQAWADRILITVDALNDASSAGEQNRLRLTLMSEAGREMGAALTQAGQAAQQALAKIRDEAQSASEALQNTVDRLREAELRRTGDESAIAELERQRQLAEIARLEEQSGNQQAADEARRLVNRNHKATMAEIEERRKAEQEARQEGKSFESNRRDRSAAPSGGISAPTRTTTLILQNQNGRQSRTNFETENDLNQFLDILEENGFRTLN